MKVSIVNVQVPFVRGGAEYLADSLGEKIRERGHRVDQLRIPFTGYPASIASSMICWPAACWSPGPAIPTWSSP